MMNSSLRVVARRYAAAYDQLSQTGAEAASRAADLAAAAGALKAVHEALSAPQVPLAQKQQAVEAALGQSPVADFIAVLLAAKRYELLPEIVQEVQALADARQHILRAKVVSAAPLTSAQKTQTEGALAARYGGTVKAEYHTDKQLLGGLKIWCNGELIDGSWQGQFNRLQEELLK